MDKLEWDWLKRGKLIHRRKERLLKSMFPKPKKVKTPKKYKPIPAGWVHVDKMNVYGWLVDVGIKPKKLTREHGKITVAPSWAVEMYNHPQRTKEMVKRAKKDINYRKVVLMEERLRKRAKGSTTNLLVHQTAVELGESVHRQLEDYRKKNEAVHLRMEEWLKRNS